MALGISSFTYSEMSGAFWRENHQDLEMVQMWDLEERRKKKKNATSKIKWLCNKSEDGLD